MSQINWNSPEERNAYFREKGAEYRKEHPRINLNFTKEEFQTVLNSGEKYGATGKKLARHAKLLLLEAARLGLGEQVERPPQVPQEMIDELQYLLHNCANNINQIAYNLNSRALETNVRPVAGEGESRRIMDELLSLLKDTHLAVKSLTSKTKSQP